MSPAGRGEARDNVDVESSKRHASQGLSNSGGLTSRGRVGILGRSGAAVGLLLVVIASALAFVLTDSTAARITLPQQIQIRASTTTVPPAVPTTSTTSTTTTTSLSSSTSTTTSTPSSSTTPSPISTSVPSTTIAPSASDSGKTIVVKVVPTVRVEDDKGNRLGDEGSEAGKGASDDKSGADT